MPGAVLVSNAAENKDGILRWQFTGNEVLNPKLFARSRKIFPQRIALLASIAVILSGLLTVYVRRRKSKH